MEGQSDQETDTMYVYRIVLFLLKGVTIWGRKQI